MPFLLLLKLPSACFPSAFFALLVCPFPFALDIACCSVLKYEVFSLSFSTLVKSWAPKVFVLEGHGFVLSGIGLNVCVGPVFPARSEIPGFCSMNGRHHREPFDSATLYVVRRTIPLVLFVVLYFYIFAILRSSVSF